MKTERVQAKQRWLLAVMVAAVLALSSAAPHLVLAEPDYPQVEAVSGGSNTLVTSHNVSLPAGVSAGDLLLVFFSVYGTPSSIDWPAGWSLLGWFGNSDVSSQACYRIADGSESSTVVVDTNITTSSAYTSYRITGYCRLPESAGLSYGEATVSPDPPECTPSWGEDDTLWIAAAGYGNGQTTVSSYPSGYSSGRNDRTGSVEGVGVGSASLQSNVSSEDPGAFMLSSAQRWTAMTVAIAPCEAPPAQPLAVGGEAYRVDKNALLVPWILLVLCVVSGCCLARRLAHN